MMIFEADPADDPDKAPASLTVVGDSDQSIYAFRGADIRNISEFERDYPGAKVVLLEQNYRSTQNILSAANAVIGNNFDRKDKKLWTDVGAGEKIIGFTGYSQHDEAQFVADEIEALRRGGIDYSQMAVFYRTNSQCACAGGDLHPLGGALQDHGRHEVLRARRDQGRARVPRRRVEPGRRDGDAPHHQPAAPRHRRRHDRGDLALRRERADHVPRRARELVGARRRPEDPGGDRAPRRGAGRGVRPHAPRPPASSPRRPRSPRACSCCSTRPGYTDALRASKDPQDEARVENLDELVAVAREFARNNPEGTVIDFLAEVALVSDADDLEDASGSVSLMTLHTAKGLEYDAVFVTGVEEDLIPHRISANEPGGPQEERRLFYVGITRARKRLYLSLAMTRAQFGEVTVAMPSRFLQEIPAELIDWRQSPGDVNSRGGTQSRALNAAAPGRAGAVGAGQALRRRPRAAARRSRRSIERFANRIPAKVRDNGDMQLAPGDRIRHDDFGEGRWMPSPARARSASPTCASTRPGRRSC